MGNQDDGALGLGVPQLADDVAGLPFGQEPAKRPLVRREVTGDRCEAGEAEDCAEPPAATENRQGTGQTGRSADPERPPVSPVGRLGLDPCAGAELLEPSDDPLGRETLTGRGRRALDLLELLQKAPEPGGAALSRAVVGLSFGRFQSRTNLPGRVRRGSPLTIGLNVR